MTPIARILLAFSILFLAAFARAGVTEDTAAEILEQAMLPNDGPEGRPLPLASHWCMGDFASDYFGGPGQLAMLARGTHIMPWVPIGLGNASATWIARWQPYVERLAELGLPLTLKSTQWENTLNSNAYPWKFLAPPLSPRCYPSADSVVGEVSTYPNGQNTSFGPFGPTANWYELGEVWASCPQMVLIQQWYPNPPRIICLSNNESPMLDKQDAELDYRYPALLASLQLEDTDINRSLVMGAAERDSYAAFFEGFRDTCVGVYQDNILFVGYQEAVMASYGDTGNWQVTKFVTDSLLTFAPDYWDGASSENYLNYWEAVWDFVVDSPQFRWMNKPFIRADHESRNPLWWDEMSTWDGYKTQGVGFPDGTTDSKRSKYITLWGQTLTPERYAALAQFCAWVGKPRAIREYRSSTTGRLPDNPIEYVWDWWLALEEMNERVWDNPTLNWWWRYGTLVPNPVGQNPKKLALLTGFTNAELHPRWFQLEVSGNPAMSAQMTGWNASLEIPVYAIAHVAGTTPTREWLLHVLAPVAEETDVDVTIPGYGVVTVDAPALGAFYLIEEVGDTVTLVEYDSEDAYTGPASEPTPTPTPTPEPSEIEVYANCTGPTPDECTPVADGGGPIDFGTAEAGDVVVAKLFLISNSGPGALITSSITAPAGLTITENAIGNSGPGISRTLRIALDTSAARTISGDIVINNNDPNEGTYNISVTGTVASVATARLSINGAQIDNGSTGYDFGSVVQGGEALVKVFTVLNAGGSTLTTSNLAVPSQYSITDGLAASILAGASDTFTIELPSTDLGTFSGNISFSSNDVANLSFAFGVTGIVSEFVPDPDDQLRDKKVMIIGD